MIICPSSEFAKYSFFCFFGEVVNHTHTHTHTHTHHHTPPPTHTKLALQHAVCAKRLQNWLQNSYQTVVEFPSESWQIASATPANWYELNVCRVAARVWFSVTSLGKKNIACSNLRALKQFAFSQTKTVTNLKRKSTALSQIVSLKFRPDWPGQRSVPSTPVPDWEPLSLPVDSTRTHLHNLFLVTSRKKWNNAHMHSPRSPTVPIQYVHPWRFYHHVRSLSVSTSIFYLSWNSHLWVDILRFGTRPQCTACSNILFEDSSLHVFFCDLT
jgi:hypothetical protein